MYSDHHLINSFFRRLVLKADEQKFHEFMRRPSTQFVIPIYQRNYDWLEAQCTQLMNDIMMIGKTTDKDSHFIGSIVSIKEKENVSNDTNELVIIDGQQRLTTVALIYTVLYHMAKEMKETKLAQEIYKQYLINEFTDKEDCKHKLKPTDNHAKLFRTIIEGNKDLHTNVFSQLITNYEYFQSVVTKKNFQQVINGLKKLVFVSIELDRDKDNPQRIFESLNSTGLDLTQADLIRNYILMGLNKKHQDKIYVDYWKDIERLARDESTNISRVSDFIRDYFTMKNKHTPNKKDIYKQFRNNYPTIEFEEVKSILTPIKKMVVHYNKIVNPCVELDKDIQKQLIYIQLLEVNVAHPFLIKVYDDYSLKHISKAEFISVLELIQSFVWRRYITGLATNSLNKIFLQLYDSIVKMDKKKVGYVDAIRESLCGKKGNQRFPNNKELREALLEKNMYKLSKKWGYFWDKFENHENKPEIKIAGEKDITTEHIFPQNPSKAWKQNLTKEEYTEMKEVYLHTIANLTLTPFNSPLGNKSFIEKRDLVVDGVKMGFRYAKLRTVNDFLCTIDKWNVANLKKRFELILNSY